MSHLISASKWSNNTVFFFTVDSVLLLLICLCCVYGLSSLLAGDERNYIMSEVQGTLEFSVELHKFHNVDLFQRG